MAPFKSEAQRKYMWAKHPSIARRWAHEYPESNKDLPEHVRTKSKAYQSGYRKGKKLKKR